jgi:polyketide cyclase/dehydrase/lipid transport protein
MFVRGDIIIERPTADVFDFVADERNEPQYNPQMTRADKVTGGPIGVGTKFHSVMTGVGGAADITIEFTEFDRPRRIAEATHMPNMDIKGVLTFEPVAQGTRMRWLWQLQPRGFYKLFGPLIRRIGERQELRIWSAMKTVLESGAPAAESSLRDMSDIRSSTG